VNKAREYLSLKEKKQGRSGGEGQREILNVLSTQGRKASRVLLQTMTRENVGQPPEYVLSTVTI